MSSYMGSTAAKGATVVDLDKTGYDDSIAWSITTNGADADSDGTAPFAINAGTGVITLADSDDIDFEVTTSYNLVVRATDGTTPDTETITISGTDVAPTVTDTAGSVSETASNSATIVDVDNTGAVNMSEDYVANSRNRHFTRRHLKIRELVEEEIVKLRSIPTNDNVSDILNKPLSVRRFKALRAKLRAKIAGLRASSTMNDRAAPARKAARLARGGDGTGGEGDVVDDPTCAHHAVANVGEEGRKAIDLSLIHI